MKAVAIFVGVIILLVNVALIESCNRCESSGGVYVKTIYGTFECIHRR